MEVNDTLGKQLHCRATEGDTLNTEEIQMLEAWYALKDAAEVSIILHGSRSHLDRVNRDIADTLERIQKTTRDIQSLAVENDAVRAEIAARSRRLALTVKAT